MSDGPTDHRRDTALTELAAEILKLESKFFENPTKKQAKILLAKWKKYAQMPAGYWCEPNLKLVRDRISALQKFLKKQI